MVLRHQFFRLKRDISIICLEKGVGSISFERDVDSLVLEWDVRFIMEEAYRRDERNMVGFIILLRTLHGGELLYLSCDESSL